MEKMNDHPYRESGVDVHVSPEIFVKFEAAETPITPAIPTIPTIPTIPIIPPRSRDKKFRKAIVGLLVFCLIGMPLMGLGLGAGVQLANNYFLPTLLNDADRRENFSFDNITHVPMGALENPLLHRQDYVALVNAVKPSVVTITAEVPGPSGIFIPAQSRARAGTGILMYETESRYYIATNAHVIEGASMVHVSIEGAAKISAVPIGRDDEADLAIIAVYKSDAVAVGIHSVIIARFGESHRTQVGEIVLAIGNAMGEGIAVTNGIVSAKDIQIFVDGRRLDTLQTNAAINRGNSGGPLVNVFGEVIGINTAKFSEQLAEGMAYAIPAHVAKPILERIIRDSVESDTEPVQRRPIMGVELSNWTATQATASAGNLLSRGVASERIIYPDQGVRIARVFAGSPALRAGLRVNDIITVMDGVAIVAFDDFVEQISTKNVGDEVTLTIIRNGTESLEIKVTLAANAGPLF